MDYEKKYKQLRTFISDLYPFMSEYCKEKVEGFFPELKESDDERIRKEIIFYLRYQHSISENFEDIGKWIAWLEKQGNIDEDSYEIAENEKREFVEDGFIKCYADFQDFKEGETYWLEYVGNDNYNVRSDNLLGKTYHITPCQLYTIFKKQTWLEKQGEQKSIDDLTPQEAMDIAVAKCFEQGEQKPNPCDGCINRKGCINCENGELRETELKPADKVEPFDKYEGLTDFEGTLADICIGWIGEEYGWKQYIKDNADVLLGIAIKKFNSVQDAPFEQKPAWSEEDERKIDLLETLIEDAKTDSASYSTMAREMNELSSWLKSLKDRVLPQPKQEWSEKDEERRKKIIHILSLDGRIKNEELSDINDWLKSPRPQNRWKPSDEQMNALDSTLQYGQISTDSKEQLNSLFNDLKKLKG